MVDSVPYQLPGRHICIDRLGEHRTGTVNQMNYTKIFAQSQLYGYSHGGDVSIPWFCSSLGYGFVWNQPSYGYVNISATYIEWYSEASANADFWVSKPDNSSDCGQRSVNERELSRCSQGKLWWA